jgi:hypothetical protein
MPQRSDQELVSWDIIGAELGMTGGGAIKIYNQALKKIRKYLRNNPVQAEAARNLLIDREPRHYGDDVNLDIECENR